MPLFIEGSLCLFLKSQELSIESVDGCVQLLPPPFHHPCRLPDKVELKFWGNQCLATKCALANPSGNLQALNEDDLQAVLNSQFGQALLGSIVSLYNQSWSRIKC